MGNPLEDNSLIIRHRFVEQGLQKDHPVEFGAVYFRRSNPPREDWERDYRVAREDGHTLFRHWFLWSDIHVAPDTFDFGPYDEHLRLAAKYGIKTIVAELITNAPDWLYHSCPEGRHEDAHGSRNHSGMQGSCATSSAKMCLDHPVVRAEAGKFLAALADHYRDMPGMYGYDIWNECSLYQAGAMCYCPSTQKKFQEWCRKKYGTLEALKAAWRRHSLTSWEDIEIPRVVDPFPDSVDAVYFYNDNAMEWMRFRADTIRAHDPNHFIAAHGNGKTHCDIPACDDMWRSAEPTDIYGYTFWYANKCNTFLGGDITRMASDGRVWWRAEALGDHDWQNRTDLNEEMTDHDEMHDPLNIRCDAMKSLAAGARGFINPRWRALQDGFLQGAFGWYNLDGSRSERSEMVKSIAEWANGEDARALWQTNPIRGDIGLLLLEESMIFCYANYHDTRYYNYAYQGAYDALTDSGYQVDPIRLKDLSLYDVVYVPFPISLSQDTIDRLTAWVERGGTLIGEACFGYFGDHGHVYERQPSRGLDALFGCVESGVHLGPDKWKSLEFGCATGRIRGGVYRQVFRPTAGKPAGQFDNGECAVVENSFGKGRTRLIGSVPGYGYHLRPDETTRRFFASHLHYAGKKPHVTLPYNTGIVPRVWADAERCFLWLTNETAQDQRVVVVLNRERFDPRDVRVVKGNGATLLGDTIEIDCPQRDAVVLEIL